MSERAAVSDRRRWIAWVLLGVNVFLLVGVFVLGALTGGAVDVWELVFSALPILAVATSATVGALVAARQHRNPIGWLFLVFPLGLLAGILAEEYTIYAFHTNPDGLPAGHWMAWLTRWAWISIVALPLILLLFPTGTPPSPRWRWLPVVLGAGALWSVLFSAMDPRPTMFGREGDWRIQVANPTGVEGLRDSIGPLLTVGAVITTGAAVACFSGMIVRFRRARGDERQQLRWLAFVGSLALAALGLLLLLDLIAGGFNEAPSLLADVLWTVLVFCLMVGIPVACGIAILKFRLYDLDVVIKKTVVFGVLAVAVTMIYVVGVVVVGTAVTGADAGVSGTFFAAVALISLALQPLRGWARRLADRLVYGKRATPYEVLSGFTERLGDVSSAGDVAPRMAQLITDGTGARRAAVWLRVGRALRRQAVWPPVEGDTPPDIPMANGELPEIPGATTTIPMVHREEMLGAIALDVPSSDPLTPAQERLLAELATQAGLALRNVALTADLRQRLEDLQRSRKRLVTAQDEERRKIERNLHDGAQQQLVAIGVKLRLADQMLDRDPSKAHELLAALQAESQDAVGALRDLARGIYPPVLADNGLAAALEAQARKSPLTVEVRADGLSRYPQDVEAATYFCVLEALQNVAKYAEASRAIVTLREDAGWIHFSVFDDGTGFDPVSVSKGSGLLNMEDRVSALGGRLRVDSEPSAGTTVAGRIPASPRPTS